MRRIYVTIGKVLFWFVRRLYLAYYPLSRELVKDIEIYSLHPSTRKKDLNKLRTDTIANIFWTNSGAVFSLLVTASSLIFTVLWSISVFIPSASLDFLDKISSSKKIIVVILFTLSILILILFISLTLVPIVLRKINRSLPPVQYTELSLGQLNQSEILTFISYRMWLLTKNFSTEITIPFSYKKILKHKRINNTDEDFLLQGKFVKNEYSKFADKEKGEQISRLVKDTQELLQKVEDFKSDYYKEIMNCEELKASAARKLGILPREFCHHVLKFSIKIFESRINDLKISIDSVLYILKQEEKSTDNSLYVLENHLNKIIRTYYDIKVRRKRFLSQLIIFNGIHEYLIGLASTTSTSGSMKVFTRGISEVASKFDVNKNAKDKVFQELKSLLHRSKAHYGIDLLISLENFYKKNYEKSYPKDKYKVPSLLKHILTSKKFDENNLPLDKVYLKQIRTDIIDRYKEAVEKMSNIFKYEVNRIEDSDGIVYFIIFGYSRMIVNVLRNSADILKSRKYRIFVFKEQLNGMLDTRILRHELNDFKPDKSIRNTFTGSDNMIFNLTQKKDKIIFLAGIEGFDIQGSCLLHTNNYQHRVENLLDRFESDDKKSDPCIWLIGGDFKIFNKFPDEDSIFGYEFFSDHYDKVDYYNFKPFKDKGRLKVITNIEEDFNKINGYLPK